MPGPRASALTPPSPQPHQPAADGPALLRPPSAQEALRQRQQAAHAQHRHHHFHHHHHHPKAAAAHSLAAAAADVAAEAVSGGQRGSGAHPHVAAAAASRRERLLRCLSSAAAAVTGTGRSGGSSAAGPARQLLLGLAAVAMMQSRLVSALAAAGLLIVAVSMLLGVLVAEVGHAAGAGAVRLLVALRDPAQAGAPAWRPACWRAPGAAPWGCRSRRLSSPHFAPAGSQSIAAHPLPPASTRAIAPRDPSTSALPEPLRTSPGALLPPSHSTRPLP